ncbi:MAG: hypothetical protein GTO18_07315 [Anaerolineales bacterium]|nr:hypothetical protein [Anaerolineales bacterium]
MTTVRKAIRRLGKKEAMDERESSEFAYRIFWTQEVINWDNQRRRMVKDATNEVLNKPDFESNLVERRYSVPGLDAGKYAGASLVALNDVLIAFEQET